MTETISTAPTRYAREVERGGLLTAHVEGHRIPTGGSPFAPSAARHLDELTRRLLTGRN
ncbi:hypothetical protein [Nocardia sp. NPDC020380]|uniref:hypothetical protein n=1 Tax=Nocardia sp. NPDC020380 TaxID=3364309 RepID=UPI00379C6378